MSRVIHPARARATVASGIIVALAAAGVVQASPALATSGNAAAFVAATNVQLEWGFSRYAQYGTQARWTYAADGDNAAIVTRNGETVSGNPDDASRDFNLIQLSGGEGTIDAVTGEGSVTWPEVGTFSVTSGANQPAISFADPVLTVDAHGAGTLSFEVSTSEAPSIPAQAATRLDVATFSAVSIAGDTLTVQPDYEGLHYFEDGVQKTSAVGGTWPQEFVAWLPSAIGPYFYRTGDSAANLRKGPLYFTATFDQVTTQIEAFKADGVTPVGTSVVQAGDVVVVKGSGFDPQANNPGGSGGGAPIPNNLPQGTYVTFGAVGDPWKPSEGGPSANRAQVRANTKWVLLESVVDAVPSEYKPAIQNQAVTLDPVTGEFEATITVAKPETLPDGPQYGIYTYAAGTSGLANAAQELFIPLNFVSSEEPAEAPAEGKELVWGFASGWRGYVAGIAHGNTYFSGGAVIDGTGQFHFAQSADSTYSTATGAGVLKYDGRIRWVSSAHAFDIVLEQPWVTVGAGTATLSANVSTNATVGDADLARVDLVTLALPPVSATRTGGVVTHAWPDATGTFAATFPVDAWTGSYGNKPTDPVRFSFSETVAPVGTAVTAAAITQTYGKTATVIAAVSGGANGGTVSATLAGKTVSAAVVNGKATLTVPANSLTPGAHAVALEYSGVAGDFAPSTGSVTITVEKIAATTTVKAAAIKQTYGKSAKVAVTVSGGASGGTVSATLAGKKVSATVVNGKATLTIPAKALKPGARTVALAYSGITGDFAKSAGSVKVTVAKATAKLKATPTKKVKRGRTLTVSVAVTATGVKPTGTVTVKVAGKSKKVKLNSAGKAKVKITVPRGAKLGKRAVSVTYNGSTYVAKSKVKKVSTRFTR